MATPIIKIENLSKIYRLGQIGTGTLRDDYKRWIYKIRGKEDPFLKIGESNDRNKKGNSDYIYALKDINLEVMPGEILGIIGKNGAGKSTLLKILSKVTGPSTGSISYNGRIGSLLEVGTGFHPELTGRENVFLNGAILGMTKTEIKSNFDEIVDFSGVERYIDTPVKRYSSGMMVRLGFAVAAHLEPEILVVDEVLAVGDAEFQKKAIGKMQDVSKNEGRTVLFVSHNMASVRSLCNTGAILSNGTIALSGQIDEIVNHYSLSDYDQLNSEITKCAKYYSKNIEIDSITVNGSEKNIIKIDKNNRDLKFYIKGKATLKMKIALEIKIYDDKDNPLFFYCPNHVKGFTPQYDKGSFEINQTLTLPQGISRGTYYADIEITNPYIETYVDFYRGVKIESEGYPTDTGFVFDYSKGHGLLFLK
ncbi:MAG: lipopolysaccharide transport system ATP-binding protein [Polaribacter sp.]|jgi:lipopolysaccharide transport system ATP-binding protein